MCHGMYPAIPLVVFLQLKELFLRHKGDLRKKIIPQIVERLQTGA